jgi:hypothetical protein
MLDFSGYNIPAHTQYALTEFVERGIPVGGFLHSVLSNDLFGAVGSADRDNLPALKDITVWVSVHAPQPCWGTEAKVLRWIADHPSRSISPKPIA